MLSLAPRRSRFLVAFLSVLLIGLIAGLVLLVKDRQPDPVAPLTPSDIARDGTPVSGGAPGGAVRTARGAVTAFYSLDFNRIDADIAQVRRLLDTELAEEYDISSADLRRRVTRRRIVSRPTLIIDGTATEYLDARAALVLVSADVTTRSRDRAPATAAIRTRVTLTYSEGDWLVSRLERVR